MSRATKKATNHAYMNGGKLTYDDTTYIFKCKNCFTIL